MALSAHPSLPLPLALGLDVTEHARILPADVARLARRAGAAAEDAAALAAASGPLRATGTVAANAVLRFVVDALRFYFEFHARFDGFYGAFIHDPFAVAASIDRTLVTTRPVYVDIESGPGLAHGMTVADWRGISGRAGERGRGHGLRPSRLPGSARRPRRRAGGGSWARLTRRLAAIGRTRTEARRLGPSEPWRSGRPER